MASMTRHQLRAARALLVLQQEVLAQLAGVGVATLRRFEGGNVVSQDIVDALRDAIESEGAILVAPGASVDGIPSGEGVVLRRDADLPDGTRGRLAALDMTSDEAAKASSRQTGGVGRRARVPVPSALRRRDAKVDGPPDD